jgi:hypothetical protein
VSKALRQVLRGNIFLLATVVALGWERMRKKFGGNAKLRTMHEAEAQEAARPGSSAAKAAAGLRENLARLSHIQI